MLDTMVICMAVPTGYGGIRYVPVSLPRVDCLIADMPGKYALPEVPEADRPGVDDVKQPDSEPERRQRATRAPSLRSMVKLAVRCQDAEELGQRLKHRYQRQRQRAGIAPPSNARLEAELERILGEP